VTAEVLCTLELPEPFPRLISEHASLRSLGRLPGHDGLCSELQAHQVDVLCPQLRDPIDGTVAFLKGRPYFTICAATVRDGRPLAGAVYNPITGECFTAVASQGARLNGKSIRVTQREQIHGCRMLGPKATFEHPDWSIAPKIAWPPMHIETRNSVAYRLALVACGAFDATVALSAKHDWDLAAADVIVQEAGGRLTAHTGATLHYNGRDPVQPSVVAAGPVLHAQIIERVQDLKLPVP